MTVKITNRSHRAVYLVLLLVFAVALTTALVLAGEKNSDSANKNAREAIISNSISAQLVTESSACNIA